MIHTVHLDEDAKVRKLPKEKCLYRQGLHIETLPKVNNVPQGYISSEDFKKRAFEKVNKFCDKHGIL